jgi:hypothetical protein
MLYYTNNYSPCFILTLQAKIFIYLFRLLCSPEDAEDIHAIDYFEILTFDNFSKHEALGRCSVTG